MAHPLVDADSDLVADLLAGTLEVIREAGGFVAPTTRLVEREGQLSVTSTADDGAPLFRIPRECFVRVDRVTWAEQDDRMVIVDVPEEFTDIETELLYIQVALHNACDKLAWMRRTHPALDPRLPDDLVAAVQALIPSFRNPRMAATDVLWANRCFRLPLNDDQQPERVLIPIVDLLNHHAHGAVADWNGREFMITTRTPFGTSECALDYGMERNALELAVVYGFVDSSATACTPHPYDLAALEALTLVGERAKSRESARTITDAVQALLDRS
jgi:hypothetical protein